MQTHIPWADAAPALNSSSQLGELHGAGLVIRAHVEGILAEALCSVFPCLRRLAFFNHVERNPYRGGIMRHATCAETPTLCRRCGVVRRPVKSIGEIRTSKKEGTPINGIYR